MCLLLVSIPLSPHLLQDQEVRYYWTLQSFSQDQRGYQTIHLQYMLVPYSNRCNNTDKSVDHVLYLFHT